MPCDLPQAAPSSGSEDQSASREAAGINAPAHTTHNDILVEEIPETNIGTKTEATDDDNNSIKDSISMDDSPPSTVSTVETSDEGRTSHPAEAKRKASKSNQAKKSSVQQITTLISSVIEQQRKDHHLFFLKEERHQRELEFERERYKLQMEVEERRHRAQMEHDQAMMRMLCQVMSSAVNNSFPPIHTPLYPTEEPSFHTLSVIHQPSASVTGQGVSSTSTSEQTLSSAQFPPG